MTSPLPFCDLTHIGSGCWSGDVVGHPVPGTRLRVQLLTATERSAGLWVGDQCLGPGLLRLGDDGTWRGFCHEYAGRWELEAQPGSGRVRFAETAA